MTLTKISVLRQPMLPSLARALKRAGWTYGGDNHWSKEGVGYIRRVMHADPWEAQDWPAIRLRNHPTIRHAVEWLEFHARGEVVLGALMARICR